jgi:hypothetical protein
VVRPTSSIKIQNPVAGALLGGTDNEGMTDVTLVCRDGVKVVACQSPALQKSFRRPYKGGGGFPMRGLRRECYPSHEKILSYRGYKPFSDARAETRLESFLQVLCSVAIPRGFCSQYASPSNACHAKERLGGQRTCGARRVGRHIRFQASVLWRS